MRIEIWTEDGKFQVACKGTILGSSGYPDESLLTEAEEGIMALLNESEDKIDVSDLDSPELCNFTDCVRVAQLVCKGQPFIGWWDESIGEHGHDFTGEPCEVETCPEDWTSDRYGEIDELVFPGGYYFYFQKYL